MGDRGNIGIRYGQGDGQLVFLYTHWGGSDLERTLAQALDSDAGRGRWDDASYLARIIFCRMIAYGDDLSAVDISGETGFGIAPYLTDNEYPILVVEPGTQRVVTYQEGSPLGPVLREESFEEFIERMKVATTR